MQQDDSKGKTRTPNAEQQSEHEFGVQAHNSELSEFYVRRLREAIGTMTVAEFARRAHIAHSTLAALLEERSLPRWESAVKIARAAGRSLDWFAPSDWTQSIHRAAEALEDVTYQVGTELQRWRDVHQEDFCLVPLYDVRAAAGHGAWNDAERVKKMLAFRREWIATDLRASPDALVLIYVDGDSMEPTLSDGDVVMVDRLQVEVRSDSIYVFTQDGALLIKRLQRLPAGRFLVISDNERFSRYELDRSSFEGDSPIVRMIGRVVWGGVRL